MKKQFSFLLLITAFSSGLYAMQEEHSVSKKIEFHDVVSKYVGSVDLLHDTMRKLIQHHKDTLLTNMLEDAQFFISHTMYNKQREPIEHLNYLYSGVTTNKYQKTTFKNQMNLFFNKICTQLKDKKTITINKSCYEDNDKALKVTYGFTISIEPFHNSNLQRNLLIIKELNESVQGIERTMRDSK